jgi:hypothetical protein
MQTEFTLQILNGGFSMLTTSNVLSYKGMIEVLAI